MKKSLKAILATAMALIMLGTMPMGVSAGDQVGIALTPSTHTLKDALRGQPYDKIVRVTNPGNIATIYGIESRGDAASWVSFFLPDAPDTPIDTMTVDSHEQIEVIARFSIPLDAANGEHAIPIVATTIETITGMGVSIASRCNAVVHVTGVQTLSGIVYSVQTSDIETGFPLKIDTYFENTGNVAARPKLDVTVLNDASTIIDQVSLITPFEIKPGETQSITTEWESNDTATGDYIVNVDISLADNPIESKSLNFSILPVGTLTRSGVLQNIEMAVEPMLGDLLKIEAIFINDGQIDTKAQFLGEAYRDGRLIAKVESDEIEVEVGQTAALASYVEIEKVGEYRIEGYINYEGKTTDLQALAFEISEDAAGTGTDDGSSAPITDDASTQPDDSQPAAIGDTDDGGSSSSAGIVILILAIVAVAAVGGGFVYKKKSAQN